MARKKQYKEEEVVEKALYLFWIKGFENTSMQMLEKEMGINKFSIYSSFESKKGLFIESLKLYRKKVGVITQALESSTDGVLAIKEYFYKFLSLTAANGFGKGCFITNTLNDMDNETDKEIVRYVEDFRAYLRQIFYNKIVLSNGGNENQAGEQADYLVIAMIGLASASKICGDTQLKQYIERTFKRV